jgi:hypothetical protein
VRQLLIVLLLLVASVAQAQTTSSTARRIRAGTTLPATCRATNPVDVFIDSDATATARWYICTSTNTWTAQGGSSATATTATAVIDDNAVVRGDGGARGVQNSGIVISDSNGLNCATDGGCDIGNGLADFRDLSLKRNLILRGSTSGKITFAAAATTTDYTFTWPSAAGAADTFLKSDGTWAAPTAGIGGSTGATDNAILRADGTGGATVQNSLVTISDTGQAKFPVPPTSPHTATTSTFPDEIWGVGATGNADRAVGGASTIIGPNAHGFYLSVAVGSNANASSGGNRDNTVAVGADTIVVGSNGIAIGQGAISAASGTAVGQIANAPTNSIALGKSTAAVNANHFVAGSTTAAGANITDVYIGSGVTDVNPTASTYHGTGGSGTDKIGADFVIAGGASTGTGAGGNVGVKTSPSGATSASANPLITRFAAKAKGVALTSAAAADVVDVALPTLTMTGGTIDYTIICTDGTDMQSLSGQVVYSAVNKAGSYTTSIKTPGGATPDDSTAAKSVSAGTLTLAWSVVSGTNKVTIKATPTTSLTPTKFLLYYTVTNNSEQVLTPD